MRRSTLSRLTALVVSVGVLAACASDANPDPDLTSSADDTPSVVGGFGEAPTIELPDGPAGEEFVREILVEGDGEPVPDGGLVVANYRAVLWPAKAKGGGGKEETTTSESEDPDAATEPLFDTFEGDSPEPFPMVEEQVLPGMIKGLVDAPVGSRVMLVLPPDEAFGAEGRSDLGIAVGDSLVFVFDILGAFDGEDVASGTDVEPDPALPTVAEGDDGPAITMPSTAPPTELISQVLIQGDGDEVGQALVVQYRGVLWKDGSEFDATWTNGAPAAFPIGTGGVIPAWDKTLVGQAIGSRVLIVVPPAEGYGEAGSPPQIAGDDTLVFVVDILGAFGSIKEPPVPEETPTS